MKYMYKSAFMMLVLLQLTSMTSVTSGQSLTGCGTTRGCFNQPPTCQGSDCTAYVTWQTMDDGHTGFTLWGQALGWVAVGLRPGDASTGNGMIPADVYACTKNEEVKRSQNALKPQGGLDSYSTTIPNNTITDVSVKFVDGVISCDFARSPSLEGDSTFYNISGNNTYFILLAIADEIGTDGAIEGYIHKARWSTSEPINLQKNLAPMTSNGGEILKKAHASLMVIGWVALASIGITMARFFKSMWPFSTLFGKQVWFTVHRTCMVTCTACTITAFILIFIHVKGFVATGPGNTTRVAHAILGIIVLILAIVNPIMALFRPSPEAPRRPLFNLAHWGVGTSAYLIGLVTIFLGIGYQKSLLSGLPRYVFFIMIAFVAFHCLMWILFEIQKCMTESLEQSNDMPMSSANRGRTEGDPTKHLLGANHDSSGSSVKALLLTIYILGIFIIVAFFVISFIIAGN